MFNPKLVEEVFQVKEYAFNANIISTSILEELASFDIEISFESTVDKIFFNGRKDINVEINNTDKFQICASRDVN